jgi:hypothetical protein
MANSSIPREILEAALHGLEAQKQKLDNQIAQVRSMLGKRVGRPPKTAKASVVTAAPVRKKRVLSAAARKRIAAAQKKRWAAFHRAKGEG